METKKNIIILSDTLKSGNRLRAKIEKIIDSPASVISYRSKNFPKLNNKKQVIILCELTSSNHNEMIKTISQFKAAKNNPIIIIANRKIKIDDTNLSDLNSKIIFSPFKVTEIKNTIDKFQTKSPSDDKSKSNAEGLSLIRKSIEQFELDPIRNINLLVEGFGKAINASAALYNRLNTDLLYSVGKWNLPDDFVPVDIAKGHICFDVIKSIKDECVLIRNLPSTKYYLSDPAVNKFQLKTYFGKPINLEGKHIGTLCALFIKDFKPSKNDYESLKLSASLIENLEKQISQKEELWISREWFNAVFKTSRDGIIIVKSNKILYANESLRKDFLIHSINELTGKSPAVLSVDKSEEFFSALENQSTQDMPHRIFEFEGIRKDKSVFSVEADYSRIKIGDEDYGIYYFRDISLRKFAVDKLKKSESLYRTLFSLLPTGILFIDVNGNILEVNEAICQILGYTKEELVGKNVQIISFNQNLKSIELNIRKIIESKRLQHLVKNIRKDGSICFLELIETVIQLENGKTGILSIAKDVTETKLAEDALFKTEEKLRALIQSGILGTMMSDRHGNILEVNDAFLNITGFDRSDIESPYFNCRLITPEEFHSIEMEKILEAQRKGRCTPYQKQYIRKDGSRVWVLIGFILLGDKQENIFAAVIDITETKTAEEALQKSLQEKEVLLREIHHRVKNNLQIIYSLLDLQLESVENKELVKFFQNLKDRVRSMALIHEKLYQTGDFSQIDMRDYITTLVDYLYNSYIKYSGEPEFEIEVDDIKLPIDSAIPCGMIISELISNSLKYAFPPSSKIEEPRIILKLKMTELNEFELNISDNGIGIPKDYDIENSQSLGLQLIGMLTQNLNGKLTRANNLGTGFRIIWKDENLK
jgi:PAS domain S-box-containing protein